MDNAINGIDANLFNLDPRLDLLSNYNYNYLTPILKDLNISSNYYTEYNYRDLIANGGHQDRDLNILSFNIQGLPHKFDELRNFLDLLNTKKIKVDILAIQETWFFFPRIIPVRWI